MPRVYQRKFDWDEARRLRGEGLSLRQVARELGVSIAAVDRVTSAERYWKMRSHNARWQRQGVCPQCGGQTTRRAAGVAPALCRVCASLKAGTSAREDTLRCFTCGQWLPDEDFPKDKKHPYARRGRHAQCRACNTKVRQEYRERMKVPCVGCGKPALPPSEKRTSGSDFPRCRACYDKSRMVHG